MQLRNLFLEFPEINWVLVGDDGQHDPLIYGEASSDHPDRIAGVAIRELTPGEHLASHGSLTTMMQPDPSRPKSIPVFSGGDGYALMREYDRKPFV